MTQAQGGREAGSAETLAPGAHETPAGLNEIAAGVTAGVPVQTQEKPPTEEPGAPDQPVDPYSEEAQAYYRGLAGGGGNYGNDLDGWIHQAMKLTGVGEDQFQWIKKKALQESGGRNVLQQIKDVNSGGNEAMGPMQIIPGTFKSNMVPGYGDRNNPVHSIAAALNYILRRYKGDFRGVAMRGGGY